MHENYIDPLWCEDCRYFHAYGMDGEGECKADNPRSDIWYGRLACAGFKPKEKRNADDT